MSDNFHSVLARVRDKYTNWILGSIDETYNATKDGQNGGTPLVAFILVSSGNRFYGGLSRGYRQFRSQLLGQNL